MQNDHWGTKNLKEVCEESNKKRVFSQNIIMMPAKNFLIIYRKVS